MHLVIDLYSLLAREINWLETRDRFQYISLNITSLLAREINWLETKQKQKQKRNQS